MGRAGLATGGIQAPCAPPPRAFPPLLPSGGIQTPCAPCWTPRRSGLDESGGPEVPNGCLSPAVHGEMPAGGSAATSCSVAGSRGCPGMLETEPHTGQRTGRPACSSAARKTERQLGQGNSTFMRCPPESGTSTADLTLARKRPGRKDPATNSAAGQAISPAYSMQAPAAWQSALPVPAVRRGNRRRLPAASHFRYDQRGRNSVFGFLGSALPPRFFRNCRVERLVAR